MGSEIIKVPHVELDEYSKTNFATETAFNELINESRKLGLPLDPVMGLMYLPSQEVTRQFQEACRAVLSLLKEK
jgi:hypothetical protein